MCFLLVFISLPCLPLSPPRCCPDSHSPLVFGRAFQLNTTFSSKLTSSCVPDSSCFNSLVAMTVLTFLALGEAPPVELPHGILAGSCDPTKGFAIVGGVTFVLSPCPLPIPECLASCLRAGTGGACEFISWLVEVRRPGLVMGSSQVLHVD